ncbi:hypothetical protein MKW98_025817 [Papaver atlanticum]|uniref:Uncharacterized protein n=1 Tax=Papaver atlanticum TaxID=357466 RepID=A0AAD4X2W0_9MAGN|nr:hypothetical protein MKW98_025817 [Papaver atlanticum]
MAAWMVAARQAASVTASRISSKIVSSLAANQASKLIQRRGLAGGGAHGPPKVNCWKDPLSPSKWKEEHFVIVSLAGWGLAIYGGFKLFSGGKKENKEEKAPETAHSK